MPVIVLESGRLLLATERGVQDSLTKALGRWQNSAYALYIKTPQHLHIMQCPKVTN